MTKPGDLVYMAPPYQGTSNRDNRYIQGVEFDEFVKELEKLDIRNVDFVVSYDGKMGEKVIGKKEITYESLYISRNLKCIEDKYEQMKLCFG